MGSHGGGTPEGQRHILEGYGITEDFVGVPIRASMEVVNLGATTEGFPVLLDRHAAEADHIGVIGRVKPHTGFYGPIESGLLKMMLIGLGKHAGALAHHRILLEHPFDQVVRSVGRSMIAHAPICFGVALVENAYDETALIEAVPPDRFEAREEQLLILAKKWLARLPLHQADLLIVDEIGKDISGSGMDTNIVGRKRGFRPPSPLPLSPAAGERGWGEGTQPPANQPNMRYIFVRGLTARTHGNATGIGFADFTTTRLIQAMNYQDTVINCLTAGHPQAARLPVHFDTDREVLDAALAIIGTRPAQDARIQRIRNTLCLEEVEVSEPCLAELNGAPDHVLEGSVHPLAFDASGNMPPLTVMHTTATSPANH